MVFKNLYLLILFILLGCSSSPESVVSSLPVIDIDKARDYPVKRIEIREVADVEYIPLETTKKSLVATYVIQGYHVSDKYIVLFQDGRDILLFDRSGKYLWTVNRRGGGPEEYHRISSLAVDFAEKSTMCLVIIIKRYLSIPLKVILSDFCVSLRKGCIVLNTFLITMTST